MLDVTEDQMINRFLLLGVTFTDQSNVSEGHHNNCVVPTHLSLARDHFLFLAKSIFN